MFVNMYFNTATEPAYSCVICKLWLVWASSFIVAELSIASFFTKYASPVAINPVCVTIFTCFSIFPDSVVSP